MLDNHNGQLTDTPQLINQFKDTWSISGGVSPPTGSSKSSNLGLIEIALAIIKSLRCNTGSRFAGMSAKSPSRVNSIAASACETDLRIVFDFRKEHVPRAEVRRAENVFPNGEGVENGIKLKRPDDAPVTDLVSAFP